MVRTLKRVLRLRAMGMHLNNNPESGRRGMVSGGRTIAAVLAGTILCGAAGCSLHWPRPARAALRPPAVQELVVDGTGETAAIAVSQYWDRNTLLIDLSAASGDGGVKLRPVAGHDWPVRLEFRVRPGRIGTLEVRATQRLVFAVPASGTSTVLGLPPGVYSPQTTAIELHWTAN